MEAHAAVRQAARRREAQARVVGLMARMRADALQGHTHLSKAKQVGREGWGSPEAHGCPKHLKRFDLNTPFSVDGLLFRRSLFGAFQAEGVSVDCGFWMAPEAKRCPWSRSGAKVQRAAALGRWAVPSA